MSLDEAKRRLEILKQEMEKKKKQKTKSKKTSKKATSLDSKIGDLEVSISKQMLDMLFKKIWSLDTNQNIELDAQMMEIYQQEIGQHPLLIDSQKLFNSIRDNSYFKLESGKLLSYKEFRQTWQSYCGSGKMYILSGRKEFVKFLTNKYKMNWVTSDGKSLKEGTFQMLYRLEREPKAIERIVQEISFNQHKFIDEKTLENYIFQFRKSITKLIKEQLLSFEA